MNYQEIIKLYEGQGKGNSGVVDKGVAAAARALGFTKSTLYHWKRAGITKRTQELIASKTSLPVRDVDCKPPAKRGKK